MGVILHNQCVPDRSSRLTKTYYKAGGLYTVVAPAGATVIRVGLCSSGGEGEDPGGNGSFAYKEAATYAGEQFQLQVGTPHTAGNPGHSWIKRIATGEVLAFADRGRGSGQVDGNAAYCIGDVIEGGVHLTRAGSDHMLAQRMGIGGGLWAPSNPIRACGPGGGGRGGAYPYPPITKPAGAGESCVEFYAGSPGY